MTKQPLTAVAPGPSALSLNLALAHGDAKAGHGGAVAMASGLCLELVGTLDGMVIDVEDHGKPLAPTSMTGRLTVRNGSARSEPPLVVAGDRLQAKGVKLTAGAKVVAALTTPAKKAITVRFAVKSWRLS